MLMHTPSETLWADLENPAEFVARHVGIDAAAEAHMLSVIGAASRRALVEAIVPAAIARSAPMQLPPPLGEAEALAELRAIAANGGGATSGGPPKGRLGTALTPEAGAGLPKAGDPPSDGGATGEGAIGPDPGIAGAAIGGAPCVFGAIVLPSRARSSRPTTAAG